MTILAHSISSKSEVGVFLKISFENDHFKSALKDKTLENDKQYPVQDAA